MNTLLVFLFGLVVGLLIKSWLFNLSIKIFLNAMSKEQKQDMISKFNKRIEQMKKYQER